MLDFAAQSYAERVIVALDCSYERALEIAVSLKGQARWMKIGMTLFYRVGPGIIQELHDLGFKIFLDLKFHDIPHQVEGAACSAFESGADMITMHAIGGVEMMQAAKRGIAKSTLRHDSAITLGVTVLTSMDAKTLHENGIDSGVEQQVLRLAKQVKKAGLSGVVASPHEARLLRETLGPDAYIVTPGVRPVGSSLDDQSRVMTPAQAFSEGASHIVIGRPITGQTNPSEAFESIVKGL